MTNRIHKYRTIRDIWTLFEIEEEKKRKIVNREKNIEDRIIKDRIIGDLNTLFEQ